jgi:hypothetical protein
VFNLTEPKMINSYGPLLWKSLAMVVAALPDFSKINLSLFEPGLRFHKCIDKKGTLMNTCGKPKPARRGDS